MKNTNYKYEVAFAFLDKDEHLANQINDLIKDKFSTFLYSKKLEDLTNTKHEKTFINVFGKQSKIVVVLFRNKWGTSPWTKIEENAIRNRAFDEDQNFLLFIPLDDPYTIPKYLPKVFIWSDLARLGIKGAANIIEERVQLVKGKSKAEAALNDEAKDGLMPKFEVERSRFLESINGLEIAELELKKLFTELEKLKNKFTKSDEGISFGYQKQDRNCLVKYGEFSIRFYLRPAKSDPFMDSPLYFELQKQGKSSNEPNILAVEEYQFEVKKVGEYGWIKNSDSDLFISSKKLAEKSIKLLLDQADSERGSK